MPNPSVILHSPWASVPGLRLNKAQQEIVARKIGPRIIDLLMVLPLQQLRYTVPAQLTADLLDQNIAVSFTTHTVQSPVRGGPWRIFGNKPSGEYIEAVFFQVRGRWPEQTFKIGQPLMLWGKLASFDGRWQLVQPKARKTMLQPGTVITETLYPELSDITQLQQQTLRKTIWQYLQNQKLTGDIDALDAAETLRAQHTWPRWWSAMAIVHGWLEADAAAYDKARQRLGFGEMLEHQLGMLTRQREHAKSIGPMLPKDAPLIPQQINALPYQLTNGQQTALAEIQNDLSSGHRMSRLLQGDVGSGKTLVAWLALLQTIGAGYQGALLAPTEVLVKQHAETLSEYAALLANPPLAGGSKSPSDFGVGEPAAGNYPTPKRDAFRPSPKEKISDASHREGRVSPPVIALLTGKMPVAQKRNLLQALELGEIDVLLGTHALFQDPVLFRQLGLVIIDEQHRFGVKQRAALAAKGENVHTLLLSATPIPRTLTMSVYGDIALSTIPDKPPGRQPITTQALPLERLGQMMQAMGNAITRGDQAYWVCPLVAESEFIDLAAATARYESLRQLYGEAVVLIHGKLTAAEKDLALQRFRSGAAKLMVATTVIEVGVNVPTANIIVIEHAERFGLAQLHQLRGRVGRGDQPASCVLLYQAPLGETAKARLGILRQTNDGFLIAEEDLRLRGAGDLIGLAQSGLPNFRIFNWEEAEPLVPLAHQQARYILDRHASESWHPDRQQLS